MDRFEETVYQAMGECGDRPFSWQPFPPPACRPWPLG